ncbi:c6 finger domain containing protein [Fusarium agapanthi]|uniref:C6 finger domain containing protein n=1 Tax=Fusarium agapanthi TaxID=1803897 RepID=A0A9P5EFJ8_9HYPO|nr:c6 finger domain containing protein [Fusarium agapanthi]
MHLKTIDKHTAEAYINSATHLRHRPLRGFNNCLDETPESNSTAQFFFASLLALHYLAETVAGLDGQDFVTTLECMVNYLRLHRGAKVMGERASTSFVNSKISQWLIDASKEGSCESNAASEDFIALVSMLETSELNEESRKACGESLEALGFVMRHIQGSNSWGLHGLMAWSNLIPWQFLMLLEKLTPEALVTLAHYAVCCTAFVHFGA